MDNCCQLQVRVIMFKRSILLLLLMLLPGCATLRSAKVIPGTEIETLQGGVAIALDSQAGKIGGRGVLFYRRPDQFRLTVLAPFGQVLMDIIVKGDDILCLLPSQNKGWRGISSDLPESLGMRIWPLLRWVVEPPRTAGPAAVRNFVRPDGTSEKVYFDPAGLVLRKINGAGDEVVYGDYQITAGVALANVIEIVTAEGNRLKLIFDEPEINQPLEADIMSPSLAGIELLPLAQFSGFYSGLQAK